MITETHIRNLQNPTKFVKIAKNSRNSTITHKSRLLKYKINKSILNQNKCQLTRNKQPPKHTAARRTPESVPSATKRIQNGQSSANHELSSDPLLRKRVRRRRCSADRRLRRSIQTNPVLLLRQQTRPPRSPAKRALSAHGTKTHRSLRNREKHPRKTVPHRACLLQRSLRRPEIPYADDGTVLFRKKKRRLPHRIPND